ncbi:MAG: Gfo/Idh/MocA family oxidoreductase [Candidatus Hydrogenedentes bacterium]|nr:Gfo/Idh/MocA family oxidoreductase [Candidatus Hydrogenedentota bacterium]
MPVKKSTTKRAVLRKKQVRVALIGAGAMANGVHYPSLAEMGDVEMTALCDLDAKKLADTARRFGISRTYQDYRRMLDTEKPDAVYCLMPPHHVFDVAMDVMSRGHHLFIEKPPGLNAFQNRRMAECVARNKVIAVCGFQRRYVPLFTSLRNRVEKRGPIHTVVVTFVKCSYPGASYYNGAIDILSCDAVHAVDTLRHYCGGEVVSVASDVRNLGAEDNNAFYAIAKFSSGATGILQTNWAVGRRFFKLELHAQGISAYADPDDSGVLYQDGKLEGESFDPAQCAGNDADWHRWGFFAENRHFIDCVKGNAKPNSSLSDTVKTMELVDRIYHSQI